jgi:DNA-binding YbaB/EbfC family protein
LPRKIKRRSGDSQKVGGGMLQQLQSLQAEMLKAQDEVTSMVVTATAGGGAVTATVTGEKRVQAITIDPEVVDPEDVEMLQDLVVAAVNSGLEQIDEAMTEKMQPFTGGLDIPGM